MEMESTTSGAEGTTTSETTAQSTQANSSGAMENAPPASATSQAEQRTGVGGAESAESVTTPAIPAWAPNFEFTVKDKKHQFDDWIKETIKTKEQEAKVRELYEKAYGLDEVKADRQSLKAERDDYKTKFTNVEQSLQTLSSYVKKGDFRTFFDVLKIPKQAIINYAIEELKYQELPPEQRMAVDQQRQQQAEYEARMMENQTLQQQMQQMAIQQARTEMNFELAKPEVASVVQAFNARAGKADAFEQEIIRRGSYYEAVHKISPPVSQLVAEVISLIGGQAQASPQGQAPSVTSPGQAQGQINSQAQQQQKPVIPNFQGASSAKSPAKRTISSIDDLRKARQSLTT